MSLISSYRNNKKAENKVKKCHKTLTNHVSDFFILETRSHNTNPLSLSEAAVLFLKSLEKAQEGKCMFCLTLFFKVVFSISVTSKLI